MTETYLCIVQIKSLEGNSLFYHVVVHATVKDGEEINMTQLRQEAIKEVFKEIGYEHKVSGNVVDCVKMTPEEVKKHTARG